MTKIWIIRHGATRLNNQNAETQGAGGEATADPTIRGQPHQAPGVPFRRLPQGREQCGEGPGRSPEPAGRQ
jgi:hypothetical protein